MLLHLRQEDSFLQCSNLLRRSSLKKLPLRIIGAGLILASAINAQVKDSPIPSMLCRTCDPPPDPPPHYGHATFTPKYYILSLLYAPPGNASSNGFTNGASEGTTTSISNSFGMGTNLSFTATADLLGTSTLGASFGIKDTTQSTQSFSDTVSSTQQALLKAASNRVDHSQDRFFLWLNPLVTVYQTGTSTGRYTLTTPSGVPMDIIDVSVAELENPALIPPWKSGPQTRSGYTGLPGLSVLTADDMKTILASDPLISVDPAISPASIDAGRFVYIESQPLEGPDYQGADPVFYSFTVTDAQVKSSVNTESASYNVGFSVGGGIDVFGLFTLKVNEADSFDWTNATSVGITDGISHQASVTLGSLTVGCYESIDIYEDTIYHTFSFVQAPSAGCANSAGQGGTGQTASRFSTSANPTALTGVVSTFAGTPVSHQVLEITLADGTVRRVYTDSHGRYAVYSAPDGPVTIAFGDSLAMESIVTGKTAVANMIVR